MSIPLVFKKRVSGTKMLLFQQITRKIVTSMRIIFNRLTHKPLTILSCYWSTKQFSIFFKDFMNNRTVLHSFHIIESNQSQYGKRIGQTRLLRPNNVLKHRALVFELQAEADMFQLEWQDEFIYNLPNTGEYLQFIVIHTSNLNFSSH